MFPNLLKNNLGISHFRNERVSETTEEFGYFSNFLITASGSLGNGNPASIH